jgi:hypothetical protein
MGAERHSVSAAGSQLVCWWLWWILLMLFYLALVDKLCMLISSTLHDAYDVIDVVNAPFVWVCELTPPLNVVVVGVVYATLAYVCCNCGGYCLYYCKRWERIVTRRSCRPHKGAGCGD